jgi:hypothetical protein
MVLVVLFCSGGVGMCSVLFWAGLIGRTKAPYIDHYLVELVCCKRLFVSLPRQIFTKLMICTYSCYQSERHHTIIIS